MKRGEAKARLDVNYNALGPVVEARLARSLYPIVTIDSIEKRLQYGCSKRAGLDPVGLPILRMSNLQPNGWDLSELKYVDLTEKERALWLLEAGDILFNRTNSKELVGKCEVFNETGEWVFASYLMRLTVDTELAFPEFVSAYLSTPSGRLQIERESRQIIGMTNINAEEIRSLQIPLPEPAVQAALLVKLDAARAARDSSLAAADAVFEGVDAFILDELCLTLPPPQDFEQSFGVRLGNVVKSRLDPQFHSPQFMRMLREIEGRPNRVFGSLVSQSVETVDPASLESAEFAYIEIGAVSLRGDHYDIRKIARDEAPSRARMMLRANDILMSMTRPERGALARLRAEHAGAIASTGFAVLRGLAGADRDFLFEVLQCPAIGLQLRQRSSGGAYPAITSEELNRIRVPWPDDPSKRAAIAIEVERRRTEARRLRAEARAGWAAARQAFEDALLGPAQ